MFWFGSCTSFHYEMPCTVQLHTAIQFFLLNYGLNHCSFLVETSSKTENICVLSTFLQVKPFQSNSELFFMRFAGYYPVSFATINKAVHVTPVTYNPPRESTQIPAA